MPMLINVPMYMPTMARLLSLTVPGALTAHSVPMYPFEKANRKRFRILNQSVFQSHLGATSKSVKRKVAMNSTRKAELMLTVLIERSKVGLPPTNRPSVSKMLKRKTTTSWYQLS